jgi:hypothetical protein
VSGSTPFLIVAELGDDTVAQNPAASQAEVERVVGRMAEACLGRMAEACARNRCPFPVITISAPSGGAGPRPDGERDLHPLPGER